MFQLACRTPASLVVFNTETGKSVASVEGPSSDDIFYDASKGRVYVLGQTMQAGDPRAVGAGFIDVFQQKDPDHYDRIARYPVPPGTRTGLFVPELGRLYAAVPHRGTQGSEILVYEPQ